MSRRCSAHAISAFVGLDVHSKKNLRKFSVERIGLEASTYGVPLYLAVLHCGFITALGGTRSEEAVDLPILGQFYRKVPCSLTHEHPIL